MHFATVLNRDGGTLRTTDLDAFSDRIRQTLEAAGHSCDIAVVDGAGVEEALTMAASAQGVDVVMAGGGDGTVSAAAGILRDSDKALAIIPAGTMNLFARGLGVPLGLDEAVAAFATGEVRAVAPARATRRSAATARKTCASVPRSCASFPSRASRRSSTACFGESASPP